MSEPKNAVNEGGGRYRTIVADPPWDYAGKTPPWRSTSPQTYPLMTVEEILAIPVQRLATADAHLYLWSVLPMMAEAYRVVKAWGFKPETVLTWCKPGVGLGGGYRGNTEHLIVARSGNSYLNPTCATCGGRQRGARKCFCEEPVWIAKGEPWFPAQSFLDTAEGTWYTAPRGDHSAKPDLFLDLIERMSPAPRIELFARRQRLGWDTWGNEALPHADLEVSNQPRIEKCPACNGRGKATVERWPSVLVPQPEPCYRCEGSGRIRFDERGWGGGMSDQPREERHA